jgi:hypothetical protein
MGLRADLADVTDASSLDYLNYLSGRYLEESARSGYDMSVIWMVQEAYDFMLAGNVVEPAYLNVLTKRCDKHVKNAILPILQLRAIASGRPITRPELSNLQ